MPKPLNRFTWYEWLCLGLFVAALLLLMYFGAVYLTENHLKQTVLICSAVIVALFVMRKLRFAGTNRRLRRQLTKTTIAKLRRDENDRFRHVFTLRTPYAAEVFKPLKSQLAKDLRVENIHLIYDKGKNVCVLVTFGRNSKRSLREVIKNAKYY